ncbi:MAG TPA: hypothetical protein PKC91_06060 [Ignavibacteria bacterium]|nr:hypothetical protein [Ignavibacteria bacterium]
MHIREKSISVKKTARYFINIPESNSIKSIWIVIHGYAQLAEEFIKEFEFLQDGSALIIAPEGLSKFYFRNKTGASWMTKEDRINEINDYVGYLDAVFDELHSSYDLSTTQANILGFSQGVHTAVRCFTKSKYDFSGLILCSSDFPKDADFKALKKKLTGSKLYYLFGKYDEIISVEKFNEGLNVLKTNGVPYEDIVFDGKHSVDKKSITDIINNKSHFK